MNQFVYFGSFSPMHIGHLSCIENVLTWETTDSKLDLIVSPQNPYKKIDRLLPLELRKEICEISINEYFKNWDVKKDIININTIEEEMDLPNYTYLTLRKLTEQYGEKPTIIFGADVVNEIPTWRSYEEISEYPIIAIERDGFDLIENDNLNIVKKYHIYKEASSTLIRNLMINHENRRYIVEGGLMTPGAFQLLNRHYELSSL